MGMTIDEIIKYLPAPICGDTVIGKEKQKEYDAHDSAIIILRKYQKIQTRLDRLEHGIECLLESDPRTFTNRECENGWLFDRIIEWRKVIREVLEDDNSNLDNSSMRSDQNNTEHRSDSGTGKE